MTPVDGAASCTIRSDAARGAFRGGEPGTEMGNHCASRSPCSRGDRDTFEPGGRFVFLSEEGVTFSFLMVFSAAIG